MVTIFLKSRIYLIDTLQLCYPFRPVRHDKIDRAGTKDRDGAERGIETRSRTEIELETEMGVTIT